MAVLPGHEHKACTLSSTFSILLRPAYSILPVIPYTNIFRPDGKDSNRDGNRLIHGVVTGLEPHSVHFKPISDVAANGSAPTEPATQTITFDYLVYALGSRLPAPIDIWCDSAPDAVHLGRNGASVNLRLLPARRTSVY
jgi:hypothetical protein